MVLKNSLKCATHVKPLPEMSHCVEPIFSAVAEPYCAKLREPEVPAGLSVNVSVVIAIVTTWLVMFTKVTAVPIG